MSSSDSDDENFVKYGTPLEPYEEDEIPTKRKFQQAPDQYAVDSHGRRRFHGAFTGGFSAGFGNSVGTPEGWTPSTFKSSRVEKAAFSNQRPEDFMDDEDRGEFGIAPKQVHTQNEFSGQKRSRRPAYHDGPIPGEPVLQQFVKAVHETAAARMLRAMGWREGQGTGERLSRKDKKKAKQQHKVYGCYMPPELKENTQSETDYHSSDSSDSDFNFDALFAPDDYEPYILHRKNDRFGLGYSGLSRHSVLGSLMGEYGGDTGTSRLVMKDKGKKVSIRGQAFGVGAFEAEDEDIYGTEDMSHYDFAIGGPAKEKEKKKIDKDKIGNVLQGFVKANKPFPAIPPHPPPALPRDYVPAVAGARRSRFEPTTHAPRDQGLGRHELTAEARGKLLGEAPVPTPHAETSKPQETPPNPPETPQEDPIVKLLGRSVNFASNSETQTTPDFISIKDSGKTLTKVFKPFIGDPKKQLRYEKYLKDKTSVLEKDDSIGKLSDWERERELVEFEQAAKLYKPLTGIMGDRFTHASEPDEAINPLCAVAKSSANHGLATKEQIEAALKGVYGVMTRSETVWRPESLVCRRFNVPEVGGARIEQKNQDKPKVSYSIFSYLESSVHDKDSFAKEQTKFSGSKSIPSNITPKSSQIVQNEQVSKSEQPTKYDQTSKNDQTVEKITASQINPTGFTKRMTVAELFLKESEKNKTQGTEVTETINKFDKMDLYKSIFLSDSEDEEVARDNNKNSEVTDYRDVSKNVERNTSPPRGIFANIDFDELNSWRRQDKKTTEKTEVTNKETEKERSNAINPDDTNSNIEAIYGPKIPDNIQKRLQSESDKNVNRCKQINSDIERNNSRTIEINSSSSEDSWVDASELINKKGKKKKSKKHKSKHKKKSKSKKKDR